jgi:hypothetical protein
MASINLGLNTKLDCRLVLGMEGHTQGRLVRLLSGLCEETQRLEASQSLGLILKARNNVLQTKYSQHV